MARAALYPANNDAESAAARPFRHLTGKEISS